MDHRHLKYRSFKESHDNVIEHGNQGVYRMIVYFAGILAQNARFFHVII